MVLLAIAAVAILIAGIATRLNNEAIAPDHGPADTALRGGAAGSLVSGHLSGQMIDAEGYPVGGFTLWLRSSLESGPPTGATP